MHDVLRSGDPERHWTDLDHLFALLGEQFPSGVVAAAALGWLEEMMAGSKEADEDAAAVRRVESHGGSLTVMSIHSSKGLEFPVVLCPQIENSPAPSKQSGVLSTPEGREFDLQRLVADKIAEANEGGVDEALQTSDEAARLIYVAMTRAKRDLVVWITDRDRHEWGATAVKPKQILSTSLLRVLVESSQLATAANLEIIAARTGGKPFDSTIEVIRPHDEGESKPLEPIDAEIKEIDLGGVTERPSIDESLRRWSYSALHVHGTSEQTTVVDVDNEAAGYDGGSQSEDVISDAVVGGRLGSKLFGGYAGSEVGNAIHEVFELTVGVLSADDSEKVTSLVGQAFTAQGLSLDDVALGEVTNQFVRLLKTPLGELFDHVSLDELCQRDGIKTANEMRFTLPLEGTGLATDRLIEIGRIASEAEPDGPYAGFFSSLAKGEYRPKRLFQGFLVGSIDLVAEVGDPGRFVVLDYKSNLLKEASSYAPDELRGEMVLSGYPLQGLLYSVALHRFLARRHKDYSPEQHLGGICYLYVRGPLLEDQCPDAGLATWKIPAQIVVGVSDLLAGKRDA
jgi:exodeoxyribonuclease V beta subunit